MNTPTNAYVSKLSSGTITALLVFSGLLLLVPVVAPVQGANGSPLTYTIGFPTAETGGSFDQEFGVSVANPVTNSFAITGLTIIPPSGWTMVSCSAGTFSSEGLVGNSCEYSAADASHSINPGAAGTIYFHVDVPTAATQGVTYPFSGTFTTSQQDGSGASFVPGASFSFSPVIDPTSHVAIQDFPITTPPSEYVAGSAALTMSATVTCTTSSVCPSGTESGLPIYWSLSAASAGYSSNTYYSLTASSTTSSAGVATTSFHPSNHAGDHTKISVSMGTLANSVTPSALTTIAAAPSAVTVTAGGSSTQTVYLTSSGTPTFTGGVLSAELASGGITGVLTDAFGNPVTSGISGETCSVLAFGGQFDNAGTATTSDSIAAGASCSTAGAIASTENYFQGLTFGTTAYAQVSMTGTYNSATFTAIGNSQTLSTSSMDTTATTPACSGTGVLACTAPQTVGAGSASGVVSTITLTYTLTAAQVGVPITFLGVNTTDYAGSFVGGMGPSTVSDPANVTVHSVLNTAGTHGVATATFTIDPTVGAVVTFKAEFAHPVTGAPSTIVGPSAASSTVTTGAGIQSKLTVNAYFTSPASNPTTKSVAGQNVYLDVVLTDYWGNPVASSTGGQLQIALAASPSGSGTFSATSVYIQQTKTDTLTSFGTITFAVSSGAALGAVTISATGFYSGSGTLTIVSPNPTITVNSPTGTVGHTVFSKFSGVGFSGTAAASLGYLAGAVTISSVTYSVDGGTAATASGTTTWTAVPTMANGLHTITFTVTDSNSRTATNTTSVLVDTAAPTITNPTTLNYGAGTPIVFTVVDTEGDLGTVSATVNGTALAASQVSITSGTNNPGSSVTYTVSVTGLAATTGHYGIVLTATDLAGNSVTGTAIVVRVTVAFATSVTVATPVEATIGSYQGISASLTNGWSSAQNVLMFAVYTSSTTGQVACVATGSASLAAGATQTVFAACGTGLPSGHYSVAIFVITTLNNPVSSKSTISVTV